MATYRFVEEKREYLSDIDDDDVPSLSSSGSEDSSSDSELSDSEEEDISELGENITARLNREWNKLDQRNLFRPHPRFQFEGRPAANYLHDEEGGVLQYFNLFIDDDLIEEIVNQTNIYANQSIAAAPANKQPRLKERWTPTNSNEIRVYFALVLAMSLDRKPDQKLYWSKDPILNAPFFPQTMSFTRYLKIKQYLHFADNTTFDPATHPNAKLRKIWAIFRCLTEKFQRLYTPDETVTIDESLMLYKGHLGWVQYIPLKRSRFGIKTFLLCESKTGYVWRMIIYTGKGTILHDDYKHLNMSSQIVMTLMRPILGKGYCLTTDSFYTSPQLADLLIKNKTDTYGPVRQNRKEMPNELQTANLKKGEVISFSRGKVMVLKWKDKKDVTLLSTVHNSEMQEVVKRGQSQWKPKVLVAYDNAMGGIDIVDQHLVDYPLPRKRTKKYYRKIFFHLVDLSLWNAYIIYTKTGGQLSPLKFRHTLIREIISKYWSAEIPTPRGRPHKDPLPHRLSGKHFPELIPPTEKKANPTKQCTMCARVKDASGKKIRRESRYQCDNCKIAMCVAGCFKVYHTDPNI